MPEEQRQVPEALSAHMEASLERLAEQARALGERQELLRNLLDAVFAVNSEIDLSSVLRRIVSSAMSLAGARYGALGVLDERGERLQDFVALGLTRQERRRMADIGRPQGRGLLGHLIRNPEPLRVDDIGSHPDSAGFPPGHPPLRTLLGAPIRVRGQVYGDLYLAERRDGKPFDDDDEALVLMLAGAAGTAIEKARLFRALGEAAEQFQRLLLPRLPQLDPFTAAAYYRPAAGGKLGGDWFDAMSLAERSCALVIGDIAGHDIHAAAAMAQTRNMLRALLYEQADPPSVLLTRLDHILHALTDNPLTTACLAVIRQTEAAWSIRWSSAGHLPPLLATPDGAVRYLDTSQDLPLGVDARSPRGDQTHLLPPGATVILYTDGLVEHPERSLDDGLTALARLVAQSIRFPLKKLCRVLADSGLGGGYDDIAILAIRTPDTL